MWGKYCKGWPALGLISDHVWWMESLDAAVNICNKHERCGCIGFDKGFDNFDMYETTEIGYDENVEYDEEGYYTWVII